MAQTDDLTILLRLVDRTRQGFRDANQRLGRLRIAAEGVRNVFRGVGPALSVGLVAAVKNGKTLVTELQSLARQSDLSLREAQALFVSVREADASTKLDNLTEALLTVKERFADARISGAGPLYGLMEDFEGFNLDLGVDNARQQLANFLEQVGKLPSANEKIFALKEVIGDEDARPFFNIINNTEKLNGLLVDLRSNINDIPGIMTDEDVARVERARLASAELANEWDDLSIRAFALYAPLLELVNKIGKLALGAAGKVVGGLEATRDYLAKLFGRDVKGDGVQFTPEQQARIDGLGVKTKPSGAVINEYGTFRSMKDFDKFLTEQARQIKAVRNKAPIKLEPFKVMSLEDRFLIDLKAANDARDPELEASKFRIEQRQREIESINNMGAAFGSAGDAFGAFAALAAGKSQSVFKTFQRLQIALSTAAGITAQIGVLASPDTPTFAQKLGAYFKIGALVASGIAGLRAINVGGGSASATSSSATSSAAGSTNSVVGAQQAQATPVTARNITVNIRGNGSFTASQVEELIEAINDNDTGVRINSNRVAA